MSIKLHGGTSHIVSTVNVNIKYEKEVIFALGVALVKKDAINGTYVEIIGLCIPLFEYTEQIIITDRDYYDKMDEVIRFVKSVASDGRDWTKDMREGRLFKLGALKRIFNDPLCSAEIIKNTNGLSTKKRMNWTAYLDANPLLPGVCPQYIKYKSFTNSYLAHNPIGSPNPDNEDEELWVTEIGKSAQYRKLVSMNKLIGHMFIQTAETFEKTKHKDDWKSYHDTLSLFVTAKSYSYMREKGHYSYLIVLHNGLRKETIYTKCMIGIRPEVMPLDEHLNQDSHESVDRHVNLATHLSDKHKNKFSKRTPNDLLAAYMKIWEPNLGHNTGEPSHK